MADLSLLRGDTEHKSIMITGAGGSIGSELAECVLGLNPRRIVLLELSEHALYRVSMRLSEVTSRLACPAEIIPVLGNVCDERLLDYLFPKYKPQIIYHAAAFKQVPLMEQNMFAVITNNSVGTYTLAGAALRHGVPQLVSISTDKAVNPRSVMGASKRVAELVLLNLSNSQTRMTSVRLCNVLGSQGSVAPLFREQIEQGGPVTVTHPEVRRYFLSLREAVHAIIECASLALPGRICLPVIGRSIKIIDLANKMIELYGAAAIPIVYTELRPGDKLEEELMSAEERLGSSNTGSFSVLTGPVLSADMLANCVRELQHSAERFSKDKLMSALHQLVPEYSSAIHNPLVSNL